MKKYTIAQIQAAWEAAYGEDMNEEYPGFIQRLAEENASQASITNPSEGTDKTLKSKSEPVQKKEWIDMTDEEKKKDDFETYLIEFILDCKRLLADMPDSEWADYVNKFDELKSYVEQK
tara:strand:+ start:64 stop:420 length:357 start_codon:yes stop_codon:yes gene_type:complete